METRPDPHASGPFEARYVAFLETVGHLRPSLHRYCTRMTGSLLDGEDVVQEALFRAYRNLDTFDDERPLAPWLFRIAHNRCIDFLRRREVRRQAEAGAARYGVVVPDEPSGPGVGRALERLVLTLPPLERAAVLLKDVFDYSLKDVAELTGSTVDSIKAALHRGRAKIAAMPERSTPRAKDEETARILHLYVELFNRRDWDGVRDLISADARLRVVDRFAGQFADSPYFANYERWPVPWRLTVGEVDGELAVVRLDRKAGTWTPSGIVHLDVTGDRITRIVDYGHCPWIVPTAASVLVSTPS